jgi:hypothetical protein
MLGFERNEPFVIKGKFAKRLREQLYRIHTGNYNRTDCLSLKFQLKESPYEIVWEDKEHEHLNPQYKDKILREFAKTLSEYVVIVNPFVKFDFKKIHKQMQFLKGYGKAKVMFKNCEVIKRNVIIDDLDNDPEKAKEQIKECLHMLFNMSFKNDVKKKQYVYIMFDDLRIMDGKRNEVTMSLRICRPYDEQ